MLSWVDAKIMSIKRDHCEGRCACQFSVILNRNKVPTSFVNCASDRVTTEVVTIDRTALFQNLHCEPREDGIHYWTSSEDWTTFKRSKLLTGTVSSEISWLIVHSILKGIDFNIKLVQNRILYHILNYVEWSSRACDTQFDSDSEGISPISEECIKVLTFRKFNETLKPKIEGLFHVVVQKLTGPDTTVEEDLGYQPVNYEFDVEILYNYVNLRRSKCRKVHLEHFTSYSEPNFNRGSTKKNDSNGLEQSTSMIASFLLDEQSLQIQHSVSREMNIDELIEWLPAMQQARLASQDVMDEISGKTSGELQTINLSDENAIRPLSEPPMVVEIEDTFDYDVPQRKFQFVLKHEGSQTRIKKGSSSSHKVHHQSSWPNLRKHSSKKKLYSSKKKLLMASECKQLMEKFMVNTKSEMGGQPRPDVEQTTSAAKFLEEFAGFKWSPVTETETETDENEDLWKEMEDSLTTLALLEQKQKLGAEFFGGTTNVSDNDAEQPCQHIYRVDDQIGIICRLCKFVCTEIRYVSPPMFQEVMHEISGKTSGELQTNNLSDENAIRPLSEPPMVVEIEDTSGSDVPQGKFQFVLKHEGSRTRIKRGSPSSHKDHYQSSWPNLRKYSSKKKLYSKVGC